MSENPQKSASNGSEFDCAGDQLPLNYFNWIPEREQTRRDVYRPVYSLHKWFARRSGMLFRAMAIACLSDETLEPEEILQMGESENEWSGYYLHPEKLDGLQDKTVLDPFMGGGTTPVEMARLGVPVIGKEINPVAWWITKKQTDPVDLEALEEGKERLLNHLRKEFGEFYETSCPKCENGDADSSKEWWEEENREGQVESLYYMLAMRVPCSKCGGDTRVFDNFYLQKERGDRQGVVYCPTCNEPKEHRMGWGRGDDKIYTCDDCDTTFDVKNGTYDGGNYTCQNEGCGNEADVKVALEQTGEAPQFEPFAVQVECPKHGKVFRAATEEDIDRFEWSEERLADLDIPLPTQSIPSGQKTDALLNYNYQQWSDLFTPRQLLVFGEAIEYSFDEFDQNTAEYLLTAISYCLQFNSLLCPFDPYDVKGGDGFREHGFDTKISPAEPNPLTTTGTRSSFPNFIDKVIKGKRFLKKPYEKIPRPSGGTAQIDLDMPYDPSMVDLRIGTSETLDLEDNSVDYVITDPPYSHNVQYSELSDFYYVWLKSALEDEYEAFEGNHTPKLNEIVVNPSAGKDTDFFLQGINRVFGECRRVLDDDTGGMVFTYHNTKSIGWQPILESILETDFVITGTYPVASENIRNRHIHELDNTSYDILIFAEPRPPDYDPDPISLNRLKRRVHQAAQPLVAENRQEYRSLSLQDVAVIVRGKLLQIYSQHYPEVYDGDEQIHDIGKILEIFDDEIEKYLVDTTPLPEGADAYTEAYAYLSSHEPLEHDEFNKWLMTKGVSYGELEERQLVKGSQDDRRTVEPIERYDYLDSRITDPRNHEDLSQIDKLHFLYARFELDKESFSYANVWEDRLLRDVADSLVEVTGDEMYTKVLETGFDKFEFE